jgi:predicted ATPase
LRSASEDQLQDLRRWLGPEGCGLVKSLRVRDSEDQPGFFEVEVDIQGQEWINLRDVGFGMSQLLPIVVESILVHAGRWPRPLVLLEQPEIHLHPKAQADLGTFITEMVRKGRRYLIETHSEYLLMRLATEVRRGNLSPEDIAIYFLSLDEHGHTQFRHIALQEDGRLPPPGEWPEGFFDTDIEEADSFLFASPKREE